MQRRGASKAYAPNRKDVDKQGRKRPSDKPKRMIERRQREGEREKER